MKDSKMMRQLYSHCQTWYNYYATVRLAVFLLRKSNNTGIINYRPRTNKAASTVASERKVGNRGRFIVQSNRNEKAQVLVSPEPWKGLTCMSVKTVGMIPALLAAVKSYPKFFPNIPKEFPGGTLSVASDSIFSLLVRRDEPGLSSLFPQLAAPIVDLLLPGAASSSEQLKLFSERS